MNDEIKEILERIEICKRIKYIVILDYKEAHLLLDYITNLQQENDKLKKLEYKFFHCSEDEESFTLEDYLELGNKVYDLEQENEKLKIQNELLKDQNINEILKKDLEICTKQYKKSDEKLEKYKSRIEKAIPMLKELNIKLKGILNIGIDIKEISDIEDTLNGKEW